MSDPALALKVPPHSTEAEQSLIGGLLIDNTAYEKVSWLAPNAFYEDRHRRIWVAITRLIEASRPADVVTVAEALGQDIEKLYGGLAYLGALAQNVPSALNIHRYAELVYERSLQRQLAMAGTEIAEAALGNAPDIGMLVDHAEAKILAVAEGAKKNSKSADIQTLLARAFERVDHLYHLENKGDGVTGVPSGFIDLDHKTSGFQAGDLIILAGRPSMGKTALALNMVEHAAVEHGLPVAIFSMEMSGGQLANRLLCSIARVDQQKLRTGRLADEEWSRLSTAMSRLHGARIEIDDTGGLTALEVRARARRIKRRLGGKLGLVVVDYLQLMEAVGRSENRATDVAEISRSMKAMAKELECPVIALSQLSRKVEDRTNKRPFMSDLRESGAIEQDADVILFIYRPEVYYPDEQDAKGLAEVIIAKQRNGPIGHVDLTFLGEYTRFENRARDGDWGDRWRGPSRRTSGAGLYDVKKAASGEKPE